MLKPLTAVPSPAETCLLPEWIGFYSFCSHRWYWGTGHEAEPSTASLHKRFPAGGRCWAWCKQKSLQYSSASLARQAENLKFRTGQWKKLSRAQPLLAAVHRQAPGTAPAGWGTSPGCAEGHSPAWGNGLWTSADRRLSSLFARAQPPLDRDAQQLLISLVRGNGPV